MAPDRIAFGRLAATAAAVVLVVSGCGGGGSSSTATTAGEAGHSASKSVTGGPASTSGAGGQRGDRMNSGADAQQSAMGKKHPPIDLPTGKPDKGLTKAQRNAGPTADIEVTLPAGLTAANTCRGEDISPAITWRHVPPGASELALFAMNVEPVDGQLYFAWAMAGIDPNSTGLKAGEVPPGAVLGRNSAGEDRYSLCPQSPEPQNYVFTLYAVNGGKPPKEGFDPLELRSQVSRSSQKAGLVGATVVG